MGIVFFSVRSVDDDHFVSVTQCQHMLQRLTF